MRLDIQLAYSLARFFSKVQLHEKGENHCWVWTGSKDEKGYGLFRDGQRILRAHRFIFETIHGPLAADELACHRCDNPPCVNPHHLFRGSHQDNVDDCIAKERRSYVSGPEHHASKLTWNDVHAIRSRHKKGISQRHLAREYSVSQYCIWSIIAEKTWLSEVAS